MKPVNYTIELYPGPAGSKGYCAAACSHCSSAIPEFSRVGLQRFDQKVISTFNRIQELLTPREEESIHAVKFGGPPMYLVEVPWLGNPTGIGFIAGPTANYLNKDSFESLVSDMFRLIEGKVGMAKKAQNDRTEMYVTFQDNDCIMASDTRAATEIFINYAGSFLRYYGKSDTLAQIIKPAILAGFNGNDASESGFRAIEKNHVVLGATLDLAVELLGSKLFSNPESVHYDSWKKRTRGFIEATSSTSQEPTANYEFELLLNFRYMLNEEAKVPPINSKLISLYPHTVAIGHSTMNINSKENKIYYSDFMDILDKTEKAVDITLEDAIRLFLEKEELTHHIY